MSTLTLGRYLFKCQHMSTVGRQVGSQNRANFGQRSFWTTPNRFIVIKSCVMSFCVKTQFTKVLLYKSMMCNIYISWQMICNIQNISGQCQLPYLFCVASHLTWYSCTLVIGLMMQKQNSQCPTVCDLNVGYRRLVLLWPSSRIFSNIQLQAFLALRSFDLKRPIIPLLKDLNLFCWHSSIDQQHFKDIFI